MNGTTTPWWQKTTIYQIYPRSYADSNGDGIGDLKGILSKLDYIQDLGFETIWISPFFRSPQQDWGYDISDYYSVAAEYGDDADVQALIEAVHQKGMRILFDLVMNHTSDQHPWFQESRRSRESPRRDWYLWRDGRGKKPPNNWKAIPGGPGWHYDPTTQQWYYASFLSFQPDLNYRNPAVKQAMFDVVRYWLDRGVDGFRLDIFHSVYKDAEFRDNPFSFRLAPSEAWEGAFFQEWKYNLNQPETFELARELRAIAESYTPEKILVGEVFGSDEILRKFLGTKQDGLNLVFLWKLLRLKPQASCLKQVIRHYEKNYPQPYTPVVVFGNHDQKRLMSRIGQDVRLAMLLALFQFTDRGVPVTYYGEEIGMQEGNLPARTALDPMGQRFAWMPQFLIDRLGLYINRDGCRTPMQWDPSPQAGFTQSSAIPWLPLNADYPQVNVSAQQTHPESLLHTYRRLLHVRRESPALQTGRLELLEGPDLPENLLVYRRVAGEQQALVMINLSRATVEYQNPTASRRILLAVGMDAEGEAEKILLPPYAGLILAD